MTSVQLVGRLYLGSMKSWPVQLNKYKAVFLKEQGNTLKQGHGPKSAVDVEWEKEASRRAGGIRSLTSCIGGMNRSFGEWAIPREV